MGRSANSDASTTASGALFSNQMAINGDRYQQRLNRRMVVLQDERRQASSSLIDDVNHQPLAAPPPALLQQTKGSVVMRNKVIDLDKNRIKCGRSKLWSRPLSFSGFFKKSLSQGAIQLGGNNKTGRGGVRHSTNYAVNHGSTDPNGNEASRQSAQLDLNLIRKLEEEIYKRGRELQWDERNAEAKDFHDFYFGPKTYEEKKTFSSDTSAYKNDSKAVLVVDSQALEPMLLKRPLSTDDALLQNGSRESDPVCHVDSTSKSIIIVDNSEFYPVLMRYDINSELVNRQQEQARKRNEGKLKINTQIGGSSAKTVTAAGNARNASLTDNNRDSTRIPLSSSNSATTVNSPPSTVLKAEKTRAGSVACCETNSINNNNHAAQQMKPHSARPPPPAGSGSGDRNKKTHSNLFQRFLLQRRSLNLSVRRRRQHQCHFRPPPGHLYSEESSLSDTKSAGHSKLKFEYLKKMQRYDPETPSSTVPHLSVNRTLSEPNLSSRSNWKSEHFLQHLHRTPRRWSTGDLDCLSHLMSSSKNFENIFESASDNLSRLSAVVVSSSSNGSPSSGSLTSSSSLSSGSKRMQSILASHYQLLQSRERAANGKPPLGNSAINGSVTQPTSGNFLRKKSSSFRGVLKRTNKPDVVNTWIYRKR